MRQAVLLCAERTFKKWVPALLILVIFMPLLVSLSLLVRQQFIRHEMLEKLEAKNLTTVIVKKSGVKWIRENREIEINGKLFDVKEITEKGNNYLIRGLYDEKEALLLLNLKKAQQSSGNKPVHQLVSKVFSGTLFFEPKTELFQKLPIFLSLKYQLYNNNNFPSWCPPLSGPPPKLS